MHPIINELAKDYYVFEVRFEDSPEIAAALHVTRLPTMVVYEDGKEVTRFTGITAKDELTKRLKPKADQAKDTDYDLG